MVSNSTKGDFVHFGFIVLILALFLQEGALFYGDSCANLMQVVSLIEDYDLDIRNQAKLCGGRQVGMFAIGARGEIYSVHEIGSPIVAAPLYALMGKVGIAVSIFISSLLGIFFVYHSIHHSVPSWIRSLSILIVVFGLPLNKIFVSFGNDFLGVTLQASVFYLILNKRFVWAGLIFGFSPFIRMHAALVIFPLCILIAGILWDTSRSQIVKSLGAFCISMLPGLLSFAAFNAYTFGAPWLISYERRILSSDDPKVFGHTADFELPSVAGLERLLSALASGVSPVGSLVILLGLLGFVIMVFRKNIIGLFFLAWLVVHLAFYSLYPSLNEPNRYFYFYYLGSMISIAFLLNGGYLCMLRILRPLFPKACCK